MNNSDDLILEAEEHYRRGRLTEAAKAYGDVLVSNPENIEALEWRGEIAVQLDDYEKAAEVLGLARSLRGDSTFTEYTNLGLCYYELNRPAEAVETLWKAIDHDPDDLVSHSNLGKALYDLYANGNAQEAVTIATAWHERFPDVPDAQHIGAAISKNTLPETANTAYVADVFNDYAATFEEKLAELGYAAPSFIEAALRTVLPADTTGLTVLDAGCGTGLCASFLRPYSESLEGVDLSPGMLEQAREKETYDTLEEAELVTYATQKAERYDLIVAADVLCYFGNLRKAMGAFHLALRTNGTLSFSVETTPSTEDFLLDASGRYKHNPNYVRSSIDAARMDVRRVEDVTLRTEYGEPVRGMVVVAQKPR